MKEITLTQGYSTLVDDEDFERLSKWSWCYMKVGYASRGVTYERNKRGIRYLHNEIVGQIDGLEIDHIDGNKLNNQKDNLRFCNRSENVRNKCGNKIATSKYKGVHRDAQRNRWTAQLVINDKNLWLGRYINEEDAAKAYDAKAKELFGEFARLNFPEE